ncbi:MAG TPA: hypothetical protein VFE98_05255 [Candidatus Bathyarchaeia archaeon]|nr:hypothetical protein [Candidatus Bathyarchaeia archaeon]
MDEKQFALLTDKLDKMMRLLAASAVRGLSQEKDKIKELDAAGFEPAEIDRFLGKTRGYSRVVIERMKKEKQPKASNTANTSTTPDITSSDTTTQTPITEVMNP